MDKEKLLIKIKELEDIRDENRKKIKELDKEIIELRTEYYKIIEQENKIKKEEELKNPPDVRFLSDEGWEDIG